MLVNKLPLWVCLGQGLKELNEVSRIGWKALISTQFNAMNGCALFWLGLMSMQGSI
jgi:hypothetical protein